MKVFLYFIQATKRKTKIQETGKQVQLMIFQGNTKNLMKMDTAPETFWITFKCKLYSIGIFPFFVYKNCFILSV